MLSCDNSRQQNAFINWNETNNVNKTVPLCSGVQPKILREDCNMNMPEMNKPLKIMRTNISFVTICALRGVGLFFINELLIGSKLSVNAGGPSIIKLTHNSCNAVNGVGKPANSETNTTITEDRLTVNWNKRKRWKFS